MDTLTLNKINDKLKKIPDALAQDVLTFIDYLDFKNSKHDWFDELSNDDITLIKQGEDDIKNSRTYTHTQAKAIIAQHLQNKTK
jgi:hypothetical protein